MLGKLLLKNLPQIYAQVRENGEGKNLLPSENFGNIIAAIA